MTSESKKSKKKRKDNGMPSGHPEDNIYKHDIRIIDQEPNPKGK